MSAPRPGAESGLAEDLLLRLADGDARAVADHCRALVACGMPLAGLIDQGLAPAMRQVGLLWQDGIWDTVDEQVATAQVEIAVSTAARELYPPPQRGRLIVACVEGEQHDLPARMLAEVLRGDGWDVRDLGSLLNTRELVDCVLRERPDAVLLSCTGVLQLPELATALGALAPTRVPVLVGGWALGKDATRARKLGASGWAADATSAQQALRQALPRATGPGPGVLQAHGRRVAAAGAWLVAAGGGTQDEALRHLAEAALVAVLMEEPGLLAAQCAWYAQRLSNLHGARLPLAQVVELLARSAPSALHDARGMLLSVSAAGPG